MNKEQKQAEREQDEQVRQAADKTRLDALASIDFSQFPDFGKYYDRLSVADLKHLDMVNETFRARVKRYDADTHEEDAVRLIKSFRGLPNKTAQDHFYDMLIPWQKAVIDADYERFNALTPEEQALETDEVVLPPTRTPEEIAAEEAAASQAEKDRLEAEAKAAQQVLPAVVDTEDLYDGIEKLGEGNYKLTVDPGDGTPVEVFFGTSQKECFKALRKSKASATKELRRRAKKVQITDELKALKVEVINYAPLVKPLSLTPDEIFTLTEQQKDPTTVLAATAKLRQASLSKEECDRQNEAIIRQRYSDGMNTAISWVNENPEFYNCPANIEAMQTLMSGLNWAVTIKNMDLAYKTLVDQGVLLDRPEEDESSRPPAQPALVVPVVAVPAVTPAAPAVVAPVPPVSNPKAPAGALPAAPKVLRPASSSTAAMPTRRIDSVSLATPTVVLTAEEYNNMPAAVAKHKYQHDPAFKAAFDKLATEGKI